MAKDDGKVKGFANEFGFGPSDHPEVKPQPLRLLAVSQFAGANRDATPRAIDAHDFDRVLAALQPALWLTVPNLLGSREKTLDLELRFAALADFEPMWVAAALPALRGAAGLLAALDDLEKGKSAPSQLAARRAEFGPAPAVLEVLDSVTGAPPAAPAAKGGEGSLDRIFDMVQSKPAAGSAIDAFAAGLGGGSGNRDVAAPRARLRRLLEQQLAAILGHPEFRELEARWRGLHALCRRQGEARVDVLACPAGNAAECIRANARQAYALVLVDAPFANTPAALDELQALAELGEELQAPVVVALGEEFFGMTPAELARHTAPATILDDARFDKWRSLREKECARWLGCAVNGFLARPPWTARHNYAEPVRSDADLLWASPVWLVGAAAARSFTQTGWPGAQTGVADGEIAQLPVCARPGDDNQFPLKVVLPDTHLKDLARAGLVPLMCQANHDSAWLLLDPVVKRPSRDEEKGKVATISWQMLAARLGALVLGARATLVAVNDEGATRANFERFLHGLLAETGPGHDVRVAMEGANLRLVLETGRRLLNGARFEFGIPLE